MWTEVVNMEIVKPELDVVFKSLFTKDIEMLKTFVGDMLDIPVEEIQNIQVLNPNILPDQVDGKQSRLDLY